MAPQRDGSGELNLKELQHALKTWQGPKVIGKSKMEMTIPGLLDHEFAAEAHGSRLLYLVEAYEERAKEEADKAALDKAARKEKAAKEKHTQASKREQELEEAHVAAEADWNATKTKLEESRAEVKSQLKQEKAEKAELEAEVHRLRESVEAAMVARQAKAEQKEAEDLRSKLRDKTSEVRGPRPCGDPRPYPHPLLMRHLSLEPSLSLPASPHPPWAIAPIAAWTGGAGVPTPNSWKRCRRR
jgi:chemotaxis protein histidine kinase CheA